MTNCIYTTFGKASINSETIKTGELISLNEYQTATKTGPARCLNCGHIWQAVAPVGTQDLECPSCITMRGLFINHCIKGDEEVKICHICNNTFFQLTERGTLCINCGYYQRREKA